MVEMGMKLILNFLGLIKRKCCKCEMKVIELLLFVFEIDVIVIFLWYDGNLLVSFFVGEIDELV